ncbi:hypothetical protein [uncultured Nocardioides sp.]|uniref:hypothetical protein n=1 Tax=uncultured Nocardioides sp. TaxID=198441 RepID=UPI0026168262|nr:hypothetical protein [uncultured Nocardioides sp.]
MAQPRVGDLVGRYRLEAVLGRDGMGTLYRASGTALRRDVAVTVMGGVADDVPGTPYLVTAKLADGSVSRPFGVDR